MMEKEITRDDALRLASLESRALKELARGLREKYQSNRFEFCAIINAKNGRCSEDCRFCAQSVHYQTGVDSYGFINPQRIKESALLCAKQGIKRFSIVTSGKKVPGNEIDKICAVAREIKKEADIELCVSLGLVSKAHYLALKNAGITRVHNNLETSRRFFPEICTTHSYDDKLRAIEAARESGLDICSGGIIGLGETMEDRIDLAFAVKRSGAISMPVNIFNPVPGTPLAGTPILSPEEIEKSVALFKIINPYITIRLAGGRNLLNDKGAGCFLSGANAAITGDLLTTNGVAYSEDREMVKRLGFID